MCCAVGYGRKRESAASSGQPGIPYLGRRLRTSIFQNGTFLSTSRQLSIYTAMSELGIPAKLIRLCRMTLSNSCSSVKVAKDLSEPLDTVRGFRQGDSLSCELFNFLMEGVHRNGTTRVSRFLRMPTTLTSLDARCEMTPLRLVLSNGSLRKWV